MLETIRDSLSHVRTGSPQDQFHARGDQAQLRTDLSHSTPNLIEKVDRNTSGNGNRMTRIVYTQKALAEIRNSLKPFKNQDEACFDVARQDLDLSPIGRQTLQELLQLGYDTVSSLWLTADRMKTCVASDVIFGSPTGILYNQVASVVMVRNCWSY
jgi:hypothetical protein